MGENGGMGHPVRGSTSQIAGCSGLQQFIRFSPFTAVKWEVVRVQTGCLSATEYAVVFTITSLVFNGLSKGLTTDINDVLSVRLIMCRQGIIRHPPKTRCKAKTKNGSELTIPV